MKDRPSEKIYRQQIEKHGTDLKQLVRKRDFLGWLRLIVFVATIIISYKVFVDAGWLGLIPATLGIGVFVYLLFVDTDNSD